MENQILSQTEKSDSDASYQIMPLDLEKAATNGKQFHQVGANTDQAGPQHSWIYT